MTPRVEQLRLQDFYDASTRQVDLGGDLRPEHIAAKVCLAAHLATQLPLGSRYSQVEVVGCGFAGATFAMVAALRGCVVRVHVRARAEMFGPQRQSARVLDPTVYDWPLRSWRGSWQLQIAPQLRLILQRDIVADAEATAWTTQIELFEASDNHELKVVANQPPTTHDEDTLRVTATGNPSPCTPNSKEEDFLLTGASFWRTPVLHGFGGPEDLHIIGGADGALQDALLLVSGERTIRPLLEQLGTDATPEQVREAIKSRNLPRPPDPGPARVIVHSDSDPRLSEKAFLANRYLAAAYAEHFPDALRFELGQRYSGFELLDEVDSDNLRRLRVRFRHQTLDVDCRRLLLRTGPHTCHRSTGLRHDLDPRPKVGPRTFEYVTQEIS